MDSAISRLSLLLLLTSVGVFARPIYIDRDLLGKPIWIMSNAGDAKPNNYDSQLYHNSFDEKNSTIRPFINWNGVLKMVVPVSRSSGMMSDTREVVPNVYNWETLPRFRNYRKSRRWRGSQNGYGKDKGLDDDDGTGNTLLIAICLLAALFILCIIVCTCLSCRHNPGCHHLKDSSESSYDLSCDTCSTI